MSHSYSLTSGAETWPEGRGHVASIFNFQRRQLSYLAHTQLPQNKHRDIYLSDALKNANPRLFNALPHLKHPRRSPPPPPIAYSTNSPSTSNLIITRNAPHPSPAQTLLRKRAPQEPPSPKQSKAKSPSPNDAAAALCERRDRADRNHELRARVRPSPCFGRGGNARFGFRGEILIEHGWGAGREEMGVVAFLRARWGGGKGREGKGWMEEDMVRCDSGVRSRNRGGRVGPAASNFHVALGRGEGVLGWRWDRQRNE